VTNRQNPAPPSWNPRRRQVETQTTVGLLPSIGLNWEF
jgi:hypothetical protein